MGRIKSRRRAATAAPAHARPKTAGKRARSKRARADNRRRPEAAHAAVNPAAQTAIHVPHPQPGLPPPIDWSAAFAPLTQTPEQPLWQELSRLLRRRAARRLRDLSIRLTRRIALMRLALRRMLRLGARGWERGLEQAHILRRALRRMRRELMLRARRRWRRTVAFVFHLIAAAWRNTQDWLRQMTANLLAGVQHAAAFVVIGTKERVIAPVLRPILNIQRETVAVALAALAVTVVAVSWLAAYRALVPAGETAAPVVLSAPAAPAAAEKVFTERVAPPAIADIDWADDETPDAHAGDTTGTVTPLPPPPPEPPVVTLPRTTEPLPPPGKRKTARRRTREH